MLLKWYYKNGIIKAVPIICLPKSEIVLIKTCHLNKKKRVIINFVSAQILLLFPL